MNGAKTLTVAILIVLGMAVSASANTARLQVIHNAADPGAAVVDVYVNGDLFLDEFAFRAATEFVDVPAGVTLEIGVAPGVVAVGEEVASIAPTVLFFIAFRLGDPNAASGGQILAHHDVRLTLGNRRRFRFASTTATVIGAAIATLADHSRS